MIRVYRKTDALAVQACIVELQEYERRIDPRLRPGAAIAADYLGQMLKRCREYSGRVFVAESEGTVAGFVALLARVPFQELDEPTGEYAFISDLVVLERFRGLGYGKALLRAAEEHARDSGASEVRIGVLSGNEPACRLYVRLGFKPHLQVLTKQL